MPGFVKTPKDEAKWSKAKSTASKETSEGSKSFWKLSNFIFHKMKKRETLEKALGEPPKPFSGLKVNNSAAMPNPMKTGTSGIAVKTPKTKKMPDPFGKPSLFFKNEEFENNIKHPSVRKLKDFLQKKYDKK